MNLAVLSANYPSPVHPHHGVFVRSLVRELANLDVGCSVIHPIGWFSGRKFVPSFPTEIEDTANSGIKIREYHPRYLSLSRVKRGPIDTAKLTDRHFAMAVRSSLRKIKPSPDMIYAHFLYPTGVVAINCARQKSIPVVVAVGESEIVETASRHGIEMLRQAYRNVSGIVAVSRENQQFCIEQLKIPAGKVRFFPNGVDLKRFQPGVRSDLRKELGLPEDKTIVVFTGHFIERKGPDRLLEAVRGIEGLGVVFLGDGLIKLEGTEILFQGRATPDQMPKWLAAADIFALPTRSEGSCNAIIEAMACGLPVVSSDGAFNDEALDNNCAIRVNPDDVSAIRTAVITLHRDKPLREQMGLAAKVKAAQFDLSNRALSIRNWILELIAANQGAKVGAAK